MSHQDKVLLMHKVEETLKPRMFANLLEEAVDEIQGHLDEFDVQHIGTVSSGEDDKLDLYINAKRVGGRSEETLVRYRYVIERFLLSEKVRTADVTPHHIREYFSKELARGVQDSTIEGIRQTLNAYFSWLEHEKLINRNPVFNIESIKCQKKERLAFSFADIEVLKRNCKSVRNNAIISFLLATGCRISEVCNLNRDQINLDEGECIVLGKGNKQRVVFLDEVAILTLREYLATRHDDNPALFVGQRHERLQPGGVRDMLHRLAEKANIENVHPHRFRRTTVTRLLNRGMPIQEVAIIVGHEKVDTTMRYYSSNKTRIKNAYRMYMA